MSSTASPASRARGGTLALALLLGSTAGAAAADTSGGSPDQPGHEMGGEDSKPGFFDVGKGGRPDGDVKNPLPAPGKAAGATSPNAPTPPTR